MQKIMTITVVCILLPVFFGCDLILSGPLPGERSTLTGSVTLDKLSPKVGESITATYTPGNGIGEQTWQWFRIEDTETEDLIQSATGDTYTATADDEGKKIRVYLSFAERIGSVSATTNTVARASDPDDPGDPGDPIDPECGCVGIEGDCDCEVCDCEVCETPDTTAPALSAGSVNRTSDTAATIGFTTDEAGTAYYLVQNSGAAAPASATVKAGTSLGEVSGTVSGKAVTLTAGAKDIYVVVQDATGNISAPLKITVAAMPPPPDNTPPALSAGTLNRTSNTAATVNFTTNEAGTAYYLMTEKSAATPANTAVRAGTSLGAVSSGAVNGKAVTLTAGEKYIYVVVQDSSNNISTPLKIAAPAYDSHVQQVNSFIGIWNAGGVYWEFRTDGTGGRANAQAGPFPDNFSFLFFDGVIPPDTPNNELSSYAPATLFILEGSPVTVTRYGYTIAGNQATLTPASGGANITLTRVSGSSQALSLTNQLIGEWSAIWVNQSTGAQMTGTWSFRYRADGTAKVYHNSAGHQFDVAYALRENTVVLFGRWRFRDPAIGDITSPGNNQLLITERQDTTKFNYTYTKIDFAEWKP